MLRSAAEERVYLLLQAYVAAVGDVLADNLVGVYLYGSVVWGAYNPGVSDVDFVAIHRSRLTPGRLLALRRLHRRLRKADPLAARLDGSFVPLRLVGTGGSRLLPYCRDGRMVLVGGGDVNAVLWHTVRTRGVAVCGPAPETLIPPVSEEQLADAMRYNLAFLSRRMPRYVLGGAESQVFGVLSLCRVLYTLHTGEIESKAGAAGWALRRVDSAWAPVVERALQRYSAGDLAGSDDLLARQAEGFAAYIRQIAPARSGGPVRSRFE